MTTFEIQFISFLVIVFIGFGFFILFLIRKQKEQLKKNLKITSYDIWKVAKPYKINPQLIEQDLIFGILQQPNYSDTSFIIKNFKNETIAHSICPTIKRKQVLVIGEQRYIIRYPLSWKRTITLQKEGSEEIIAKYFESRWPGNHKIKTLSGGEYESSRSLFDLSGTYQYSQDRISIGLVSKTIAGNPKGRFIILPESLPLEIRLFILLC